MLKSRKVRLAIGGGAAFLLLGIFFRGIEWSALGQAFLAARPGYLLGIVVSTVLVYVIRAWRWGYLLDPLAKIRFLRLFSVTIVGFTAALVYPRAQEILRPYLLTQNRVVRFSSAFATIILERLFDLLTVLVLVGLYIYVLPLPTQQTRGILFDLLKMWGFIIGLGAVAILLMLILFHVYAERAIRFFDRLFARLPERIAGLLTRSLSAFSEGLAVLKAPSLHLLAIAGQSLLLWLTIALGFHYANLAYGLTLPFHATFLMIAFLTVGVSIPTPGMVGGYHEAYLLALTRSFGIDKSTAAAASISSHALVSLTLLVMGLYFLGREGLSMGRMADIADHPSDASAGGKP
jgi:uncharacterized protein (TIRG00374 family)